MKALILSFSNVHADPRVLRQIRWLREAGFSQVNVIGSGAAPENCDVFYELSPKSSLRRYLGYVIRSGPKRFNYFFGRRLDQIENTLEWPDLLVVNEPEFLAWTWLYQDAIADKPTYLDLHEDHLSRAHTGLLQKLAFERYWSWQTDILGKFVKTRSGGLAVTSVEAIIAEAYSEHFGVNVDVLMNAPDFSILNPSPVTPEKFKLVHHGIGTKHRGIETSLKAMRQLPENYYLTLVLIQSWHFKLKLKCLAIFWGVSDRVDIRAGLPLKNLVDWLSGQDIAIVLQSSATANHLNSLPNKLFESIHARLAVVCAPNPAIRRIVEGYNLGLASRSWKADDLAATLLTLDSSAVTKYKSNANLAARELSASVGQELFNRKIQGLMINRDM